jgi:hypothetical protein
LDSGVCRKQGEHGVTWKEATMAGELPEVLSPQQTGEYLNVTISTLKAWRSAGIGPQFCRTGPRLVRYRLIDLRSWIEAGRSSVGCVRAPQRRKEGACL